MLLLWEMVILTETVRLFAAVFQMIVELSRAAISRSRKCQKGCRKCDVQCHDFPIPAAAAALPGGIAFRPYHIDTR